MWVSIAIGQSNWSNWPVELDLEELFSTYGQRRSETIPAGLEGNCNAFDLVSCFLRFLTPAIEKLQQCALVDRELLQRLALDARHDAGNQPARQAHFDHCDQCAVLFQDDTGLAQVVRGLHWGAPSVHISDDGCNFLAAAP